MLFVNGRFVGIGGMFEKMLSGRMSMFLGASKDVLSTFPLPVLLDSITEQYFQKGKIVRRDGISGKAACFLWLTSGHCRVKVAGEEQTMTEGMMFYVLYRDTYEFEVLSEKCVLRSIGFYGPLAEAILLSYSLPRFLVFQRSAEELWLDLVRVACSNNELDCRHVVALILDLLACVSKSGVGENSMERQMERALGLIQQQMSNPELGVNYLCEKLLISRSKLTEIFHRYFKWSPGREILNRKLARAYSLLRGTDYPVAKIARECGFRDPKTFSRFIRRSSGCGPREFRERYRRENEKPAPKNYMEPV